MESKEIEVRRALVQALEIEGSLERRVIEIQKQLVVLRNELESMRKALGVGITHFRPVSRDKEDIFTEVAKAHVGAEWKNLSPREQKAVVRAVKELVRAYKERRKASPEAIQVLGDFIRVKRTTSFNLVLLNLPVNMVIEKESPDLRKELRKLYEKGELVAFKGGSGRTRPASISERSFANLTRPSALGSVRTTVENIILPVVGRRSLASI